MLKICITFMWNHLFQVLLAVFKIALLHNSSNQLTFWECCSWQQHKLKQNNKKTVATRNPIFTLSSSLAKLRRKKQALQVCAGVKRLRLLKITPGQELQAYATTVFRWTASISFLSIPVYSKQPVWAGRIFTSPMRHSVAFKPWSLSPLTISGET